MGANIGDMVVKIVGDNSSFDASIDSSSKKLERFESLTTKIGKSLSLFVTAPILAAGVAALKSAGQMQLYNASFETMLGGADKASKMIADMQKMAQATPFELSDLAESGKMLLQYGIDSEKIMPMIKTLGDISQGSSAKLQTLSLAFGQMSSTGKLMGQDLLQMINAGFNPLFEISQKTGESMASLKDKMSKGQITVDMVTESFQRATTEGGKFFGGMEKASQTLPGLLSTLKDDIGTLGRSFVTDLMPLVMNAVKSLSSFAQTITNLDNPTKAFITTMLLLAAAAGPVATGIGLISKALLFLAANPIGATIAVVGVLTAALISMKAASDAKYLDELAVRFAKLAKETGLLPKQIDDITSSLEKQSGNTLSDMTYQIERIAQQYGASKEAVIKIGLENQNITGQYKNQLLEIQKQTNELKVMENVRSQTATKLERDQKKVEDDRKKAEDDLKKEIAARLLIEQEGIKERKEVADKYSKTIADNYRMESVGLITSKELYQKNYDATKKYAEELVKLGYNGKAVNGVMNIGNTALALAVEQIKKYEVETANANKAVRQINVSVQRGAEVIKEREEEAKASAANEKKRIEEEKKNRESAINTMYNAAWEVANALSELYSIRAQKEINAINKVRDADISALRKRQQEEKNILDKRQDDQLEKLDTQLQEELYKKGYASAETIAQYQSELDSAIKTGDEKTIQRAKEALEEAQIKANYAEKERILKEKQASELIALKKKQDAEESAIEKAASDRTRKLAYDANMVAWRLNIASTIASGARAMIESFVNSGGFPWGLASAAAMGAITAAQIAILNENRPRLAEGGIVMPTNGGTAVTVGEGGKPEAVLPLDKLDSMLNNKFGDRQDSGGSGMIHLVQNLNGQVFLDMIFPATKNRTILLDHGAIV